MGSEWHQLALGEAASFLNGDRGRNYPSGDAFVSQGAPFVNAGHLVDGRLDWSSMDYISPERLALLRGGRFQPGDVLFCLRGTLGKIARVAQGAPSGTVASSLVIVRANPAKCDAAYLYYVLVSPLGQALAKRLDNGSAQPNISVAALSAIGILLPSLPTQRAITRILGALDDKIDLNRRTNETLEAMARALFQSWFVDFDPVKAKAEGRAPVGMDGETAALFSSELVESGLGAIPKGWRVTQLRNLTGYFSRGIGPSYVDVGGICVLNQKCIRDRRVSFEKARRHDPTKRAVAERQLQSLDVLVNSTGVGTLGRVGQIWNLREPAIVDSHVTVLRADAGVDPWFFGLSLLAREKDIEALGEGSTGQTELSRNRLGDLLCVSPDARIQAAFGRTIAPLLGRIPSAEGQSGVLAALRDTLLPKLLSGELSVAEAETTVGRAL